MVTTPPAPVILKKQVVTSQPAPVSREVISAQPLTQYQARTESRAVIQVPHEEVAEQPIPAKVVRVVTHPLSHLKPEEEKSETVITSQAAGPLEFETKVARRNQKVDSDSDSEEEEQDDRVPIYIGISLHHDSQLNHKMASIFHQTLDNLLRDFKSSVIEANVTALKDIWSKGGKESGGWRKPDDYHVTCLYLGRDEEKQDHKIYKNFVERVEVDITIYGIVVVPNKIVAGICFPEHPVENRCPHVTLMINEWQPVMSNTILEASCARGASSPFAAAYEELRLHGQVSESHEVLNGQVKLQRESATTSCYFVALQEPVTISGITKVYN